MGGHFIQESHKMVNIILEIEDICKQGHYCITEKMGYTKLKILGGNNITN